MMFFYRLFFPAACFLILTITSCAHTGAGPENGEPHTDAGQPARIVPPEQKRPPLTVLFAGDIMAHRINYSIKDFDLIWNDIASLIQNTDLSCANMEAPVDDNKPWSTYPQFNMHGSYPEAAVRAGFNVFSLANNHTNDQGLSGITATRNFFSALSSSRRKTPEARQVWACGIKETKNAPLTSQLITVNGWTVLFAACTELLNSPDYASYIDYYPSTGTGRAKLMHDVMELRKTTPCDLFILSIHSDEPEYVRTISENQQKFYRDLIASESVDVVWANHPHVVKNWELRGSKADNTVNALIMYANGNTISAQRIKPDTNNPDDNGEYVGEGLLIRAVFDQPDPAAGKKPVITKTESFIITTYIDPSQQFVIRLLDEDFIHSLERSGLTTWARYYDTRKKLMENIQGTTEWQ
jgi:hypothetical protein